MTTKELNRDIKRLYNDLLRKELEYRFNNDLFFEWIENSFKIEFKRLYRADDIAEYISLESLKMMMRMNHTFRIIAFHQFYLGVNIKN